MIVDEECLGAFLILIAVVGIEEFGFAFDHLIGDDELTFGFEFWEFELHIEHDFFDDAS